MNKNLSIASAICLSLLFVGLLFMPAISSEKLEADESTVTIGFGRCIVSEISKTEWNEIKNKLWEFTSFEERISFLNEKGLISASYEKLTELAEYRWSRSPRLLNRIKSTTESAIPMGVATSIEFEFEGITAVLGLNTFFTNISVFNISFPVGMDLATFHIGNVSSESLIIGEDGYDPGLYVGGMLGFLGFWAGERIGLAMYENLTVIGLTGFTAWYPIAEETAS